MPKFDQKGFAHLSLVILLLLGIGLGVYLVQQRTNLKPKAEEITVSSYLPPFEKIKSVTIHTTEFDKRIPQDTNQPMTDWQSGWENESYVSFMKNKIDSARKIGFNTVWLVFPWQRKSPSSSMLNETALNNLKQVITHAQNKNMNVILPLVYCGAGWCWGGGGSAYLLSTDPNLWQNYKNYTKSLVSELKSYPNIHYLLFSENMVPQVSVLRDNNYPQYKTSFISFWQKQNETLASLNQKWGTNFANWQDVMLPPNNLSGANDSYAQAYYLWAANIVKETLGTLVLDLKLLKNPNSKIGYHDYLWSFQDKLGDQSSIPDPNPYDFLSVGYYPDYNHPENYQSEPGNFIKKLELYKQKNPNQPIFIGELGADSITYAPDSSGQFSRQSYFINQILTQSKDKIFGFNIWQLTDYNDPQFPAEGMFGLIKSDGSYKQPTVNTLRDNFLRPQIDSGGVAANFNPWAVWLSGKGLNNNLIYVVHDGESLSSPIWLDYKKVNLRKDNDVVTFQLPSNSPPSKCNAEKSCNLLTVLYDPLSDLTSNPYSLNLPSILTTSSPSPSLSPLVVASKIPSSSPSSLPTQSKKGDLNSDGKVDFKDFSILLSKWGSSDKDADLNGDGRVNTPDLSIFLSNFGK